MEKITQFLEFSTIHGLYHISTSVRYSRLFWIWVVIGGFSGAGYLIYTAFQNWEQSPISTTIETLPISQITFPNVTVCPPRNSFLNLNYDIMQSQNITLDNNARKELFDYSLDVINDEFYEEIMANLSKVEDPDRFYNWYHGYATDAVFPADITHSMKFVSLNAIFLSFPIGCQFQFQILAHRWLDSSMLHSCSTSCT